MVKDFHYQSLHHGIDPIVFYILPPTVQVSYYRFLSARLDPAGVGETMAYLEDTWRAFQPGRPFTYSFLDAHFDALYRAERRLGTLFGYCALLAVFVACLGLFGLAAYAAEQRTKEVGVRKVLGASAPQIVVLLSKDFVRLVAVAFVVAAPVAYFAMHRWLEGFAYRTSITWDVFAAAGLAALAVALVTVGFQAVRAALADPVKALRYE